MFAWLCEAQRETFIAVFRTSYCERCQITVVYNGFELKQQEMSYEAEKSLLFLITTPGIMVVATVIISTDTNVHSELGAGTGSSRPQWPWTHEEVDILIGLMDTTT